MGTVFGHLVDRFWRWELRRHDPTADIECGQCLGRLKRADAFERRFCSQACAEENWWDHAG